ncbi:hypothetical protein C8R44DRAFT_794566 [Mycena epipterygia]|nr:hypothetical protein C8R44DRAFT_794566 [Mycena epipterygia]
MTLALLKLPLILCDIICMRITSTPPNPRIALGQHIVYIPDWRERFLQSLARPCVLFRTISYTLNVLQICLIIASHTPTHAISKSIILHASPASTPTCSMRLSTTPVSLLGTGITLVGTILRVQCYRALGRHFTFELSLQKGHKLITHGPYAIVRHPSYTAIVLTLVGAWMTLALRGSYVWECTVWGGAVGRAIMGLWMGVALAVIASLFLRVPMEDDMLKERFGSEWEEWKRAVPSKIIPVIF